MLQNSKKVKLWFDGFFWNTSPLRQTTEKPANFQLVVLSLYWLLNGQGHIWLIICIIQKRTEIRYSLLDNVHG